MPMSRAGRPHREHKELFKLGLSRGWVTVDEIERAMPSGSMSPAERWLLYYSLRAAEVEIRDESGSVVGDEDQPSQ